MRGIRDLDEAHALIAWIQGQVNDIYERRDQIAPRYTSQAGLKVMEILKLLPMTNCRALRQSYGDFQSFFPEAFCRAWRKSGSSL